MLRKIRIALATLSFLLLLWLFLDITGTAYHWAGWLAKMQFLPALLALNAGVVVGLIVLTLVFGRIYCSVVCPLGIVQDLFARLRPRGKKVGRYSYSPEVRWLRYLVLALFVVALVAGVSSVAALLAPYSSFGRIVTHLLKPAYIMGNNALADVAARHDSYAFYHVDPLLVSLPTIGVALVSLLLVAILAWVGGRTYCNTVCPVGTLLSFFSRFSFLKIRFDQEKCRNCSACSRVCKASCIDYTTHSVDASRCVVCGDCLESCKFGALTYGSSSSRLSTPAEPSSTRRTFLLSSLSVLSAAALAQTKAKTDGGLAEIEDKKIPTRQTPLTPPGSLSARHFAQHCTACQLCVSQCPNGVLRPSSGLVTLMQPTMSYESGYCRPECNRCSEVCPTGAIKPITCEEKSSTQIGHAVWIKKNCVVLTDDVDCGNCARHCPAGAIQMVPINPGDDFSPHVPAVNESRCIGCGACEHLCPARPFPAIYVEGHEVHKEI